LIVRHVPREGIASFRTPIEAAGYAIDRVDVGTSEFADADFVSPDLLIMMGGPMGVYDHPQHPWIRHEIERVEERLDHGLPTLGVCLGAQIIAAALGADVFAGGSKEIGFAELVLAEGGERSLVAHLDGIPVLHWHGDTFDLPPGTELLASTPSYRNQGFRRGNHLLALQFHAEMGLDPRIHEWIDEDNCFLQAAGLEPSTLRDDYARFGPSAAMAGQRMIAAWLAALDPHTEERVARADAISMLGQ
jgi:GMP synthase (glutamine-hydrolysing)